MVLFRIQGLGAHLNEVHELEWFSWHPLFLCVFGGFPGFVRFLGGATETRETPPDPENLKPHEFKCPGSCADGRHRVRENTALRVL